MKNKIKIVERIGMPETNSSSSHSVSISMARDKFIKPGDKEWDVVIEDGILKIPGNKHFGWEYFKTNSLQTKLQYLCGIYCSDILSDSGKKRIVKLKRILKEIFKVQDVEFLWITKYAEDIKTLGAGEAYYDYPEIDHNSSDIFEEITENIDVIRGYLFSRDSWLYGGNDNSDAPEDFFETSVITDDKIRAIVSVDFGGKIGRVDWTIKNFPFSDQNVNLFKKISTRDEFEILEHLYYDRDSKSFKETIGSDDLLAFYSSPTILTFFSYDLVFINDRFNIIYSNSDFRDIFSNKRKELKNFNKEITEASVDYAIKNTKEDVDYLLLPLRIRLIDFDNYEI